MQPRPPTTLLAFTLLLVAAAAAVLPYRGMVRRRTEDAGEVAKHQFRELFLPSGLIAAGLRELPARLVPCDDLGDPGDVDTPADLPERLRVP